MVKFYLYCIHHVKFLPRGLRVDRGQKIKVLVVCNLFFNSIQMILWLHGVKRFMYGKSTFDQRIEAWWGVLKKLGIHWWINLFKDIVDTGMFDLDSPVVKEGLLFSSWTSCKPIWIE